MSSEQPQNPGRGCDLRMGIAGTSEMRCQLLAGHRSQHYAANASWVFTVGAPTGHETWINQ